METKVSENTLSEIVRKALDKKHGDVSKAAAEVMAAVRSDDELLLSLVLAYVESMEAGKRIAKRAAVWSAAANHDTTRGSGHRVYALAAGNAKMLLDFPLRSGKLLRNATKGEVRADAEDYFSQADDMRHKSKWLALVADRVPDDGKTVGDVLTEAELLTLRQKAKHERK